MNVVALEQPRAIFIAGNRQKLITALKERGQNVIVIPKEKHLPTSPQTQESEFALNVFFDGTQLYPIGLTQSLNDHFRLIDQHVSVPAQLADAQFETPGVCQYIWRTLDHTWQTAVDLPEGMKDVWVRPMPFGDIAFLSKLLHVSFLRLAVRSAMGELRQSDRDMLLSLRQRLVQQVELVPTHADFQLHLQPDTKLDPTRFEMGSTIQNI